MMTALAIELRNVSKQFPFFALKDVSLTLEEGQIMGFVGPNGAGKSTTIRILMGLLAPVTGSVRVLGLPIPQQQIEAKRQIGFVSDDMALFNNVTLAWHIDFVRAIYPDIEVSHCQTDPASRPEPVIVRPRLSIMAPMMMTRMPETLIMS